MNKFTKTNKSKKFILVLVLLILFNFCFPRQVNAWGDKIIQDIAAIPAKILYMLESGTLKLLNNIFCDIDTQKKGEIYISPENIIKGKFVLLNANIFDRVTSDDNDKYYDAGAITNENGDGGEFGSSILNGRDELRNIISGWYYALRNFAIVALLSVLVYVGIRMITSTISQDKAKYKAMLKDWLVALCLLFAINYIMLGTLKVSEKIAEGIGSSGQSTNMTGNVMNIISNVLYEKNNDGESEWDKNERYTWTNPEDGKTYTLGDAYSECLILLAIVVYTIIFLVKYLKRMMTIIFLILIAPISCITYPIDKIADGKAQAYNRWFQEFFFQVIIQPFHLLIYVVLVGSATELATTNVLYSIMCFAVMLPAEKFIREMFGFRDKLGTPLGDMMRANAARDIFKKMMGPKGGGGKLPGKDGKGEIADTSIPPDTKDLELPGAPDKNGEGNNIPRQNGGEEAPLNGATDAAIEEEAISDATDNTRTIDQQEAEISEEDTTDIANRVSDQANKELGENGEGESENNNKLNSGSNDQNSKLNSGSNDQNNKLNEGNNSEDSKKTSRWTRAKGAMGAHMAAKRLQKYGNTKILGGGKQFGKRVASRAGNLGKRTIRGAATLAGAAALGLVGTMFGRGKEGAFVGAALGNKVGKGVTNKLDTAAEYLGVGMGAAWGDEQKRDEEKAQQEFKSNVNNIKLAKQNFRSRNGSLPTGKELGQELDKMYKMDSYGIKKDQFKDVLLEAEDYEKGGMNSDEAMQTAMYSALQAQNYSAKDFRDEKSMKGAYNDVYSQYIAAGVGEKAADEKTRQILKSAAKMKGVKNSPLPPRKETLDKPLDKINSANKGKKTSDATIDRSLEKRTSKREISDQSKMDKNIKK